MALSKFFSLRNPKSFFISIHHFIQGLKQNKQTTNKQKLKFLYKPSGLGNISLLTRLLSSGN